MSDHRAVFRPEAQAELREIPRDIALRTLVKPTEPESDPFGFDTTALVSRPERRRLRVGDYRAVHTVDNGEPTGWVVHVGHRSTVYGTQLLPVLPTVADSTGGLTRPLAGQAACDDAIRR
ncbi:type II toxin-antitoxin system RelE/ParE family toxin [Streptomyces sp. TRM43335]|uniref:Type II toxin-antitoxin system RelE/ParE family toxin n=1 Tax=Streptomyces taklimakanensis TaxID=2569853 RepID=A0A6G2BFG9_9ACTN|nr:type II toxin-antitoxin system RelE/ParE family toxin [Streptomyces taklimakanensis]